MTKGNTLKLINRIRAYFPSWTPKISPEELLEMWAEAFKKYDMDDVETMLDKYIRDDESGFAPSINKLIPKQNAGGFRGRTYSHEDYMEMERAALEVWDEG